MNRAVNRVLFEYTAGKFVYRGVEKASGGYQVEKRGIASKSFRAFCWTGSLELCLEYNSEAWRHYYLTGRWPAIERAGV